MSLQECFENRQLRIVQPDSLKATASIQVAGNKLKEARDLANADFGQSAIVTAYAAMFHACRALLYRDGVQEKSHFCLALYVREKYAKAGKLEFRLLTVLDALREERHAVMYSLEKVKVKQSEVDLALASAEQMIAAVKAILEK